MIEECSNRQDLMTLLLTYRPHDAQNADSLDKTLKFISESSSPFGCENVTGHITASAWILNASHDYVLLTHHRKLNKWLQLGGHTESHEFITESAMREANEESGLKYLKLIDKSIFDIDVHEIPARGDILAHSHYDIRFVFESDEAQELSISVESHDLKWIKIDEIETYTSDRSILRMVEKTKHWL